jgi:putative DNA primase/helicase
VFSNIGCYPDESVEPCPDDIFNIWTGYAATQVEFDQDKVAEFQYVLKLWANGDDGLYQYLLGWMRFLVANPAEMTKTALFVHSKPGSGKGFIIDLLAKYVMGRSLSRIYSGVEQFVEKHDCSMLGKKLIYINEMGAKPREFMSNFNKMKAYITDDRMTVNPKGGEIIEAGNVANFILATNHINSLYLEEGDRRYTCISVDEKHCGSTAADKKWWKGMMERNHTQETGDHVYSWLMSLDPETLPDPRTIYKTKLRAQITKLSASSSIRFINEEILRIDDEELEPDSDDEGEEDDEETEVQTKWGARELYNLYAQWCERTGEKKSSEKTFCTAAATKLDKKRGKNRVVYKIRKTQ